MSYLYLPPDLNVLAGRTVTSVTGTPDTDHPLSWLTDQRPAFPIRYPAGAWKVSVSAVGSSVSLVVLANSSIDGTVTVGGSLSGTITPGAPGKNGIRLNPYLLLGAPTGVATLTLEGTNTAPMLLGEAFAGVPRSMPALKMADVSESYDDGGLDLGGEWSNIPMHDYGRAWRVLEGSQTVDPTTRDEIVAWWEAQRANSLPSVLIMDEAVNDARVVMIGKPQWKQAGHKHWFDLTLLFYEYPRYRWN